MKNFKYINIIENKRLYKIIETVDTNNDFKIEFIYDKNKVYVNFIKNFILNDLTWWDKLKHCYRVMFNKKIELSGKFEFENGLHVVNVSDLLYIYSREIKEK